MLPNSSEFYAQLTRLRGTMSIQLDAEGRPVPREVIFPGYIKHVFLLGPSLDMVEWRGFPNWDPVWDIYIGDRDSRRALSQLTGGTLPNELYQIELVLDPMSRRVPPNGGQIDGPFVLTTHHDISNGLQLRVLLSRLSTDALNRVLHSSWRRTLKA
jgi:hypothetical protein